MFGTTAIIDTGASTCCINKKVIPEDALEPLTQTVFFNGLNSRQQATHKIKQGSFLIKGNKFKIPLIYAFDMHDSNGIEMLIGANFLRSMKGGIRIEGDEITIYKKVTKIKTSNQTEVAKVAITELEVSEEEFMNINESIYFNQERRKAFLEQFKPVIERLKHQGYIREEPLKHWKKNDELCNLYDRGTESFIAVYIDDILVFSKNEKEHAKHLEKMLKIYEDNGLVLSPTKMKIAVPTIGFLGAVIGEGTIKILLRPLYEKTNALDPSGFFVLNSDVFSLVRPVVILLGSSKTCIFPSVLFKGSLPLIEKLSSLLAKLDIESSSLYSFLIFNKLPLNWQDSSGDELLNFVEKVFNLLDLLIKVFC
ncbi:RNA-directed DNA polymerase [Tanacetum coccineum]